MKYFTIFTDRPDLFLLQTVMLSSADNRYLSASYMKIFEQLGLSKLMDIWTIRNITQKNSSGPIPCRNLQASGKAGKFGSHRANCKPRLATCRKTKYTGMYLLNIFILQFLLSIGRPYIAMLHEFSCQMWIQGTKLVRSMNVKLNVKLR